MSVADRWRRFYFLTPTFRPVGGVVKIFDYLNHARTLGLEPVICCPEPFKEDLPLFRIPRFSGISPATGFRFVDPEKVSVGPHDLAFVSYHMGIGNLENVMAAYREETPVDEPTYDVRFRAEDLWPNGCDPALVHVGVFQSYLERAE